MGKPSRIAKVSFAIVCLVVKEALGGTRKQSVQILQKLISEKKI
jgi:hypothetical protein